MKDLLKVSDDLVIVGLHDRVFVGPFLERSTGKEQLLVELVPSPFQPNNNTNTTLSSQKRPQPDGAPPILNSNPVQAVALYQQQSSIHNHINNKDVLVVWCAVARSDKSLAVYRLDRSASTAAEEAVSPNPAMRQIPVAVTHRTSKRASALCFATVPPAVPESSSSSSSEPLLVMIAADLAGDAVAFSTQHSSSGSISQHVDDNVNEDPDPLMLGGTTIPHRRLLLGHTASMLTSLAIVEQPDRPSLILTADRDEKIRVSSFPNTHSIQGYLLGHTAFVSCIDTTTRVVADQQGEQTQCWCVSLGGDNTLRLWDCHTCQQLAMVSITNHNNDNSNDDNQQYSNGQVNGDADNGRTDESDHQGTKRKPVPSKVSINARGDCIATICDDNQKIDVWKVLLAKENGQDTVKIIALREFLCPNQPLAIHFYGNDHLLVLHREPEFLKVYNITSAAHEVSDTTKRLEEMCAQLGPVAASIRFMPTSVLERDAHGNLIMAKVNEQRGSGVPKTQPWNNAQRIDTAKERQKRWRKRKAAQEGSGEEEEEENNGKAS